VSDLGPWVQLMHQLALDFDRLILKLPIVISFWEAGATVVCFHLDRVEASMYTITYYWLIALSCLFWLVL
jgi:hypothetical protein